jgi:GNAT superfamily N-acetyltransferase
MLPGSDMAVTITRRGLTAPEAARLHEELKTTPNILGYTVRELLRFTDVLVAEAKGDFAGACLSKDLAFGWTDIAVLYVLPAFRGTGVGTRLYAAAWEADWERGRHIITLSRAPQVIHLMERFGMELTRSAWRAPFAYHMEMNWHMMSLYRWREMMRKSLLRDRTHDRRPWTLGTKRRPRS